MATYRGPRGVEPPAELLTFNADHWADPTDPPGAAWRALQSWCLARKRFGEQHPNSELGNALHRMQAEGRVRRRLQGGLEGKRADRST